MQTTVVTIEFWQLILAIAVVLSVIAGLFALNGKLLFNRLDERQAESNASIDKLTSKVNEVERDVLLLRSELPDRYVRREDHIRSQTVIEAKLDAISSELKLVQIQGAKRAGN